MICQRRDDTLLSKYMMARIANVLESGKVATIVQTTFSKSIFLANFSEIVTVIDQPWLGNGLVRNADTVTPINDDPSH